MRGRSAPVSVRFVLRRHGWGAAVTTTVCIGAQTGVLVAVAAAERRCGGAVVDQRRRSGGVLVPGEFRPADDAASADAALRAAYACKQVVRQTAGVAE